MPTNCRLTATFHTSDNILANFQTNTWTFRWLSVGNPTNFANAFDMVQDFYTKIPTGQAARISQQMPSSIFSGTITYRIYDLSDPEPRVPLDTRVQTGATLSSGDPLPSEVSCVVSFQSVQLSGTPQARRRNRIYLPTFTETTNGTDGRLTSGVQTIIRAAARDLLDASAASLSWQWNINSSYFVGDDVPVDNGWVDNSWDTQRRRGVATSNRGLFTNSIPA